jgi:hypothetical protein
MEGHFFGFGTGAQGKNQAEQGKKRKRLHYGYGSLLLGTASIHALDKFPHFWHICP